MAGSDVIEAAASGWTFVGLSTERTTQNRRDPKPLEAGDPCRNLPPGQAADIATTSLPVAAFHHHCMSDDAALTSDQDILGSKATNGGRMRLVEGCRPLT